jgi:FixJ family two-component response regulator
MIASVAHGCYSVDTMGGHSVNFSDDRGKVGVVDDDESIRVALSSLLRSAGYKCALFASAEAFLESGRLEETDCMVVDVRMPGLSGLGLQLKLREMNCPIPVIFVTGHADYQVRAKALAQGAAAFFGKPFSDEAFLGAISSVLNRRAIEEERKVSRAAN